MTWSRVFSAAGTLLSLQGIGAGAAVLSVLVLTALLGADGYGRFVWALAMAGLCGLVLQAGLPMTILKTYAPLQLDANGIPHALKRLLLVGAGLAGGLALMGWYLGTLTTGVREEVWMVPFVGLSMALGKIADATLRSAGRPERAVFAEQVLRVLIFIVCLAAVFGGHLTPDLAMVAYGCATIASAFLFLTASLTKAGDASAPGLTPNAAHVQVALSRGVGNHLPLFISGFFVQPELLAYLALALRLTGPIDYGVVAARAALGADIAGALKAGRVALARSLHGKAIVVSVGTATLGAVAVLALIYLVTVRFPGNVLSEFSDTSLLLSLFIVAICYRLVMALPGPAQMTLVLLDDERAVKRINILLLCALAIGLFAGSLTQNVVVQIWIIFGHGLALTTLLIWRLRVRFGQTPEAGPMSRKVEV